MAMTSDMNAMTRNVRLPEDNATVELDSRTVTWTHGDGFTQVRITSTRPLTGVAETFDKGDAVEMSDEDHGSAVSYAWRCLRAAWQQVGI